MAKRKKAVLIGATALLLIAFACLLLVPKIDSFTWIRKYPTTEVVTVSDGIEEHEFVYHDGFPDGLLEEAAKQPVIPLFIRLDAGHVWGTGSLSVNHRDKKVTIRRRLEQSWIEERWEAIKLALGVTKQTPRMTFASR